MPEREFDLIAWIRRAASRGRGVRTGIGDDCAVLDLPGGRLLATTDVIVSGVDFLPRENPVLIGRKAANVNFSDVAAMGGRPLWLLASLTLPPGLPAHWARKVTRGLLDACRAAGASLVGGDLSATSGPAAICCTALGEARKPVLRSGARPGDAIGVTGPCGGSILRRHLTFRPRVDEGLRLARVATAMIDVSDGLTADLDHILDESRVGADLDSRAIPVHADARRVARRSGRTPLDHALTDGEDFELLFTCPPRRFPRWARRIGTITRRRGLRLDARAIRPRGYEHVLG
ncbi:MAG: thiamine-monophosphate kinase [Planctomycetia bacterium]|nr:thiamine-monophosphate kinase [Planctomycetia bacterium]